MTEVGVNATREYEVRQSGEDFYIEKQYACINGLSAWFTVAVVNQKSPEEDGYTDGQFPGARERADAIASSLNGDDSLAIAALREIVRLRLQTDIGSLRVRADMIWEIATKALAKSSSAEGG